MSGSGSAHRRGNAWAWVATLSRWPRNALIGVVQAYRYLLKPWLGNACRFEPTCSAYAMKALQQHGALVGATLTAGRLLRCHPWCQGGCDDVPAMPPRLFSRLLGSTPLPPDVSDRPAGPPRRSGNTAP